MRDTWEQGVLGWVHIGDPGQPDPGHLISTEQISHSFTLQVGYFDPGQVRSHTDRHICSGYYPERILSVNPT